MNALVRRDTLLVALVVAAIALVSARPYAGGWNDGSRLAAAESLVDYGTLAIDQSMFVDVPAPGDPQRRSPYAPDAVAVEHGTLDKILIDGRFYSDKSPVPNLYLAAAYATAQRLTGLRAAREPGVFTYVLTVLSAGLAFVVAAVAVHRTSRMAGLAGRHALALTASFATASLALVYARQVNHHIMLLAIACLLTLALLSFARAADHGPRAGAAAWAGTLGGIGYTIDLGVGPILWLTTGLFLAAHARSLRPAALYALSSVPWLALHHAVNYAIAGSFLPANMIPAYFAYPGSPFSRANMTGFLQHEGVTGAAVYALEMLWGKKGFVLHNLPLLALVALPSAWRHWSRHERAIAWWAIVWIGLAWLLYAAASNNMGGGSISIRWFVPFLGPLWLFLALSLRDGHMSWNGFQVLAAFGIVLSVLGWWVGPWSLRMVPGYWFVVGSAVLAWAYQRRREARRSA